MALVTNIRSFLQRHVPGAGKADQWPFAGGKYRVLDESAPVVIAGNNIDALAEDLAALETPGICMLATQCRGAAEVEKLLRNIGANMAIHSIVVTSSEDELSAPLSALVSLLGSDIDLDEAAQTCARKIRSRLDDTDLSAIQRQVRCVALPGRAETDRVVAKVSELAAEANRPNTGFRAPVQHDENGVERVIAARNIEYELQNDKAGNFFVCIKDKKIVVEHFSPKNELLRVIEGHTARDLCITLIRNGWVSKLDHAAWLGRELLRAELSMQAGDEFVPDRTIALKIDKDELIRH